MLKIVCDKCGKAVFTTSVESTSMKNRITILDRQYDLCRECKLEVMMFINGKMPYEDCEDCETHLKAQSKTENSSEIPNNCELQTIRCPKCGRTDYIRDMEKDMGIKDSHYKYKCINCNFYIKTEPTTERGNNDN